MQYFSQLLLLLLLLIHGADKMQLASSRKYLCSMLSDIDTQNDEYDIKRHSANFQLYEQE